VTLLPKRPPGRANRKALAFASEILSLRAEGYSLEAIRQALADAGVEVSLSTVRREAARRPTRPDREAVTTQAPQRSPVAAATTATPVTVTADPRSSREIAESFVKNRVSNPLIRARSNS
jgi:DNA-binding transcriptional MerR regulator